MRAVYACERQGEGYSGTDTAVRMAMTFICRAHNRNHERYECVCERKRQNIAKRWNDTKNTDCERDAQTPQALTAPTREAVERFAKENDLILDMDRFWRYYKTQRWLTRNGRRPINWQERRKIVRDFAAMQRLLEQMGD